jgi:hypothetical protein
LDAQHRAGHDGVNCYSASESVSPVRMRNA